MPVADAASSFLLLDAFAPLMLPCLRYAADAALLSLPLSAKMRDDAMPFYHFDDAATLCC